MDEQMKPYLIIGAIVVAVLIISLSIIFGIFFHRRKIKKLGVKGEKKVASVLGKYALLNHCKVINNIFLPLYDKTTQIDHILIGYFGVLVVETKNMKGEIYGNPSDKEWTQILGDKKHKFYNPMKQNQTHIDNIRYVFNKENIYNIQLESLVVFADPTTSVYIPRGLPVVGIKKLKKFLKQPKLKKDNGVDVDKIYNAIMKHAVKDKQLIADHNKNVKKMAKDNH